MAAPAPSPIDTVSVKPLSPEPNGTQRTLISGYGIRFVARVKGSTPPLSRSQADDLADAWAAAVVQMTGGDPDA